MDARRLIGWKSQASLTQVLKSSAKADQYNLFFNLRDLEADPFVCLELRLIATQCEGWPPALSARFR